MAKVFIEESTLTKIGNAIRSKTGKTELIDPSVMDVEITSITTGGGSDIEVEDVVLTGNCQYACAGAMSTAFIELFPTKVSTKDINNASYMFYNTGLESIPFELNFKAGNTNVSSMFQDANSVFNYPDLDLKHTNYASMSRMFYNNTVLESLPKVLNAYPSEIQYLFYNCRNLREIPEDFFDTWNFSRLKTYNYAYAGNLFSYCYSLRKLPAKLFTLLDDWTCSNSSNLYGAMCDCCEALDEIVGLPVATLTATSNMFNNTCQNNCHLQRFTFKMNDDGTPKTAKWKSQTLDLSRVGYDVSNTSNLITHNSGITTDKKVTDDASYQALKNDPDWWTVNVAYSRYNHDSAVETINSLPDTIAYGTNTIKFKKAAGSATDGGAIETLTAEEIAVAVAKGWTVTLV